MVFISVNQNKPCVEVTLDACYKFRLRVYQEVFWRIIFSKIKISRNYLRYTMGQERQASKGS